MRKNLLNKEAAEEIIARAEKLEPSSQKLWGTMDAAEMLHHCNAAMRETLQGKNNKKKTSFKQGLLKNLFLFIIPRFPKGTRTPKRFDIKKSNLPVDEFEKELKQFVLLVNQFTNRTEPIEVNHPVFGSLHTKEWGIFTWMHLDHHLRQFNV